MYPTQMRVQWPLRPSNFAVSTGEHTTCPISPRSSRSSRSPSVRLVAVGTTTAPSLTAARVISHSSTWGPSITRMRSPACTPWACSQLATWEERSDMRR